MYYALGKSTGEKIERQKEIMIELNAYFSPLMHEVYLYTAIASGVLMVLLSFWVVAKPSEKASWVLFKFSSPYLAVLFIALMVDSVL